ncbi:hypothetical protein CORC01_05076 [Colletotrichum orchidophilum]|uniref:Uncharacterized protein n=1 Tax=Colletotrichum orchidophilum TaxID=1209926 RepID=A0A1G4BEC5_9PEZI|nr:uncharacterized protein CORC01_05076 [Colletotrichum orchidophilum]OHE99718.1 hypothetical protein CORC01_05076 [Colletotrichum orchidophilum]
MPQPTQPGIPSKSCLRKPKRSFFRVEKKRVRFNGEDQVRIFQRRGDELIAPPRNPSAFKNGAGFEDDDDIVNLHLEQANIHKRLSKDKAIMDRYFLTRLLTPGTKLCRLLQETLFQRRKKTNAYMYRQNARLTRKRRGNVRGKYRVKKLHWEFAQRVKSRLQHGGQYIVSLVQRGWKLNTRYQAI